MGSGRPVDPSLSIDPELLAPGLRPEAGDGRAVSIEPNRPGNVPLRGDSELGSKKMVELII